MGNYFKFIKIGFIPFILFILMDSFFIINEFGLVLVGFHPEQMETMCINNCKSGGIAEFRPAQAELSN